MRSPQSGDGTSVDQIWSKGKPNAGQTVHDQWRAQGVSIPAGAMIEVVRVTSDGAQTLEVLWDKRELNVLACDLRTRGKECIAGADPVLGLQGPEHTL